MASTSIIKKLAIALYAICMLLGLVLIAFGVYVLCSYDTNDVSSLALYGYIAIGVLTLVVSCLVPAVKNSVCCSVIVIILCCVALVVQIQIMSILTINRSSIASNLANDLDTTWEEELRNPGAMSIYENWFTCCGRASPFDYIVNERLPPETCFRDHDTSSSKNLIEQGCRVEFEAYWLNLLDIFNIIGWILIAVLFFSTIVSCCLCNSIRNDHRRALY